MDRMLYIGMSGAKESMLSQTLNTNNLANVSTNGFRADLEQFRSQPVFGPGLPSRAYAMSERPGIDFHAGIMESTGRDLDVAITQDGWFSVQAPDGSEAYTRAGDLRVSSTGLLTNGSGHLILGNGGPISIPPADSISIGVDGTVTVRPLGQGADALVVVDRLKMVNPPKDNLEKSEDGLFRLKDGGAAAADASVRVQTGFLERSNVNVVEAMVKMINLARNYEFQIKSMKTAEDVDRQSTSLLRMS